MADTEIKKAVMQGTTGLINAYENPVFRYQSIRKIDELLDATYNPDNPLFGLFNGGGLFRKDSMVTASDIWQALLGRQLFVQYSQKVNLFNALPKVPWVRTGFRMITARAATPPSGGVSEGGALPATIKPTTTTNSSCTAKTVAHDFDISEIAQLLGPLDDGLGDPMSTYRDYVGKEHLEHLDKMLLTDNDTLASVAGGIESIDRIIGDYAEIADGGITANDLDIYGINRDADTTDIYGANVSSATSDRELSTGLIDEVIFQCFGDGLDPSTSFILTGHDTLSKWSGLLEAQNRNFGTSLVQPGINGVKTVVPGKAAGIPVATYYGMPILVDQNVPLDTISRIYVIDTRYMEIGLLAPTQYFQSGINVTGDPFAINKFANEGCWRTVGEVRCRYFKVHGKLRDLQ